MGDARWEMLDGRWEMGRGERAGEERGGGLRRRRRLGKIRREVELGAERERRGVFIDRSARQKRDA